MIKTQILVILIKKNEIIRDFYQTKVFEIIFDYFKLIDIGKLEVLGSGTQGVVLGFPSEYFKNGFNELSKISTRQKGPYFKDNLPNEIAMKFQLLDGETSYWEKRMLREEYIMNYLNEISNVNASKSIIKNAIPKLYYGCTIKFKDVKFRLTFMELISPRNYITIEKWLTIYTRTPFPDVSYKLLEKIIESLWASKISHNDLSIRNIMIEVGDSEYKKIKLIDFGLSEMLNKEILSKEEYEKLFKDISKDEQRGSNVEKLKDLCKILKRPNC
jgi:serine/threonine protein kinase